PTGVLTALPLRAPVPAASAEEVEELSRAVAQAYAEVASYQRAGLVATEDSRRWESVVRELGRRQRAEEARRNQLVEVTKVASGTAGRASERALVCEKEAVRVKAEEKAAMATFTQARHAALVADQEAR
ncbi:unnamed protein product, partial [Laminaria digitata]